MLPAARFAEARDSYLAGADPRDPRASPLFGRFAGAPPVLIQASGRRSCSTTRGAWPSGCAPTASR